MTSKKNGSPMAFITLDDRSARQEIGVFGEAAEKYRELCQNDNILIIRGKADYNPYKEEWRINADAIYDYYEARYSLLQKLDIHLNAADVNRDTWQQLKTALDPLADKQGVRISITLHADDIHAKGSLHLPAYYRIGHEQMQHLNTLLNHPTMQRHY